MPMKFGLKKIFSRPDREEHPGRNVILTGIPRSGTTMACRLLCECTNTVALNEPLSPDFFEDLPSALSGIHRAFQEFRQSLMKSGMAPARTRDGQITDNAYSQQEGQRERVVQRTMTRFDQPLQLDFLLIMKHCAEFTLILPELRSSYEIFAIIRNPLAIWSSWASVDVPVSRGRVAKSGKLLPAFARQIDSQPTLFDKQLFILDWYFSQYQDLPPDRVIRYEDLIQSNGTILERITAGSTPGWSLEGRNQSKLYDQAFIERAGEALLRRPGAWSSYYPEEEIHSLLQQIRDDAQ